MSDPDPAPPNRTMSEDQGLKSLCAAYGVHAFVVFAGAVVAKHGGPPAQVRLLQQEVFAADLGDHSTSMDVALLGTWPDGSAEVLLLVEHHSEIRKVRPKGLAHYIASMIRRHDDAEIYPVLFITDRANQPIPDHVVHVASGKQVLRADWTVVRLGPADQPRLRAMQGNRIAAVLQSLIGGESTRAAVDADKAMLDAGFTGQEILLYLPLVIRLAKMSVEDQPHFKQLLSTEVPAMRTFIDDERDLAIAHAELNLLLDMVTKGRATAAAARAQIKELLAGGTVTKDQADEALAKLPKRTARQAVIAPKKRQKRRR
jgi:hypothetical protein